MKKIGFVGLGNMGSHMARNLMEKGCQLTVYDLNQDAVSAAVTLGAAAASSAKEVAAVSEVVITMLPNSPHVKTAVLGKNGVLEGAKKGLVLIDMSSIDPCVSQEVEAAVRPHGVRMLDAPVSGGIIGAEKATLSIMVGGEKALFGEVEELLHMMGKSVVYCGDIGAGNTTKLANQVIVAANLVGMSEAMVLAKKAGVDGQRVFDAIRGGLAGSVILEQKMPMILAGQFISGGHLNLHIKDLQNALDTAHKVGASVPFTAMMMEIMQHQKNNGEGTHDHCCVIRYFEEQAGVEVRSQPGAQ